jgi:hypothetical protein
MERTRGVRTYVLSAAHPLDRARLSPFLMDTVTLINA